MSTRIETRPELVLCALCMAMGIASFGYHLLVIAQVHHFSMTRVFLELALIGTGWLPFAAKSTHLRSWITMLAAIGAIPLSRVAFGGVMHDISVGWPDHDRWCMPDDGRLLTTQTTLLLLFLPIVVWSGVMLTRSTGRRGRQN